MIIVKIHDHPKGKVIAICDENLLDRILDDGKYYIDIKKHKDFYNGSRATPEQVIELLKKDYSSVNVVGKESVEVLINENIISQDDVVYVLDVPIVQIYKI